MGWWWVGLTGKIGLNWNWLTGTELGNKELPPIEFGLDCPTPLPLFLFGQLPKSEGRQFKRYVIGIYDLKTTLRKDLFDARKLDHAKICKLD